MTTRTLWSRGWRAGAAATIAAVAAVAAGVTGCGGEASATAMGPARGVTRASDAAGTQAVRTLRLESQLVTPAHRRPVGGAPGASMAFTGMVYKPGGAAAIGRSQGSCTRTAPGAGEVFECLLSFVLPDGTIYAQSTASTGGPADGVLTGGTRGYATARGTFRYRATGSPRVALTMWLMS